MSSARTTELPIEANHAARTRRSDNVAIVSNDPDEDEELGSHDMPDDEEPRSRDLPAMISGGAAAIAGIRLGPEAALLFGTLAYKFEPMVEKALSELRPDTRRRAAQMLEAAAERAGYDADQLDRMIGESDRTRLMTGLAIVAAQRTTWPPKVVALGKALADGLIADDAMVNVADYVLAAMSEMEQLHVSLLDLLVRYKPEHTDSNRVIAAPISDPSRYSPRWAADDVPQARPKIATVLTGVSGTLIRHGLVDQTDQTFEAWRTLTKRYETKFRNIEEAIRSNDPDEFRKLPIPQKSDNAAMVPHRIWEATELGEKVLGYYLEAGGTDQPDVLGS